ncbi:hypothetical protein [Arthrobacter sp. UYP6]|uniref:hypothetical protein n=1 Tax=Arthrobacter sp. UYP6 TaxID=1756378 RepID=UPI003395FA78
MISEYNSTECFDYLDAVFPGYHLSGQYRPNALEEQRGSLSWGASLVGRSYLRVYEKTGDHKYLRGFIGIGEQLLLARDQVRGAVDYLGRSGPVWRSGRPYTTNYNSFRCGAIEGPCLEIRSKQAAHIRIENIRHENGTFDISFLSSPQESALAAFEDVSVLAGTENNLAEVLTRQHWKSPQAAAVISHYGCVKCLNEPGLYDLVEQYYAPAIHVSQICLALLEFSKLVNGKPDLYAIYGQYADKYTEAALAALEVYDSDYRVSSGRGYYIIPADAPSDFEGTDAPQNHNMSMALCFLSLYRITEKATFKSRATELVRTFRDALTHLEFNGQDCLVWSYFVPMLDNFRGHSGGNRSRWRSSRKGNPRMEDMSHAVLAIEAAVEAHLLGIEVTALDLQGMANTFVSAAATGTLSSYIDGTAGYGKYDAVAGRWSILGPWDSRVYEIALRITQTTQPQPLHASVLLSCANLVAYAPLGSDSYPSMGGWGTNASRVDSG